MRFWQRYSPHHEASLSGVGSFAIHFLVAGMLILAGYLGWLGLASRRAPVVVDAFVLDGGGGGKKTGTSDAPGDGGSPKEVAAEPKADLPGLGVGNKAVRPDLSQADVRAPTLPPPNTKKADGEFIQDAKQNEQAFRELDREIHRKLLDGLKSTPRGKDGPGAGGGDGRGKGPGTGPANGPDGNLTQREQRMLRWTIQFDTRNGQDYVAQLKGLGAILAIAKDPKGRVDGDYWIIRDLGARPPKLLDEDVRQIQRIFWIDDKRASVDSVMRALGLNLKSDRFIAFMPQELEEKLFELEKKFRGLREDDIEETVFKVRLSDGKYAPYVVSQKEKRKGN
jgi:hypothetical protein